MKKALIILLAAVSVLSLSRSSFPSATPNRIVSLAPNLTEILFEMGLGERVVGVTQFCDYPPGAVKKPKVGGMSNPSAEAVVSLRPDLVVMTTDGNPREFEGRLRSLKINSYLFKARRLSELPGEIRRLGAVLGAPGRADILAGSIENTLSGLRAGKPARPQKILFIIWPEPLIVAGPGTAIDDSINLLGHTNIASRAGTSYPKYSVEEIIRQSPDVIFIGMGHTESREISKGLLKKIAGVSAVRDHRVYFLSDSLYRLSPRVLQGIREMAKCLK